MLVNHWIDVHAHFSPPAPDLDADTVVELMRLGDWKIDAPPAAWEVERTLAYMDRTGIRAQLLSNIPKSLDALRDSNDFGAKVVAEHPGRFGLLAALPTDDSDAAMAEIDRASTHLAPDGYAVTCRYNDVYLSDSRLDPVWAELDRRRAVVFAHPDAYTFGAQGRPAALLEVAFETARTFADMLYAGTLRRYPNITWVVAHCGGALPALSGRLELLGLEGWVPNPHRLTPSELSSQLRRLYLDTAATAPTALGAALAMTSARQLVYGSDCGVACTSEATMDANLQALLAYPGLDLQEVNEVGTGAARLFPRLTGASA